MLVLEKQPAPGGSSALSGGWFAFCGTDLQREAGVADSDGLFLADMITSGGGYADARLLDRLVERQGEGIRVIDAADAWTPELKVSAGMSVARAHLVRIRRLLAFLEDGVRAGGADLRVGQAVGALLVEGGRVVGVRADGTELRASDGVILTTGGFSRSRELLDLFVPDQATAMPYGGAGNTGDGLRMAWRLGADLADVGHVAGTYGQHPDTGDDEHELLTANYLGAIIVNSHGERFTDESDSYKVLGAAALAQPGGLAFQIFDAVVRARSRPGIPLSDMERLEELGHMVSRPSIAELAAAIGVPREALQQTVADYNGVATGTTSDAFGRRGLVNGTGVLAPISRPPYYAYPAVTAMTSTYGGIRVDPDTGVVRVDGARVAGLHAAGEVVGGFHGASYMTGTALTKALVFGIEAADAVVRSENP